MCFGGGGYLFLVLCMIVSYMCIMQVVAHCFPYVVSDGLLVMFCMCRGSV